MHLYILNVLLSSKPIEWFKFTSLFHNIDTFKWKEDGIIRFDCSDIFVLNFR